MIKLKIRLFIIIILVLMISSPTSWSIAGVSTKLNISPNSVLLSRTDDTILFDSEAGELIGDIDGGSPSACLEAIDYDGDGDMDYIEGSNEYVFIATNTEGIFEKTMVFSFLEEEIDSGYVTSLVYGDIAVGDFNNDGQQDFITGGDIGRIRIFINNNSQSGVPRFDNFLLKDLGQAAYGLDAADFNDDGWLDFAVSWDDKPRTQSTITIFYNNGNFTFNKSDIYHPPEFFIRDLNVGDYDVDGDIDIIFTKTIYKWHGNWPWNVIGAYYLLENRGDDTFKSEKLIAERGRDVLFYLGSFIYLNIQCPIRNYFGFNRNNPKMTSADYDGDGDIDFLVGDNSGMVEFFRNDGQGNFESDSVIHKYGHLSWGLASGDFDNDGDIDFVIGALDAYQEYYNGHVWLKRNYLNLI
jgi:hypothetical protein